MIIAALGQGYAVLLLALFLFPISMHFLAQVLKRTHQHQVSKPTYVNLYVQQAKPVKFEDKKVKQKVKIIGTPKDIINDGIQTLTSLKMRRKDAVDLITRLVENKNYTSLNELVMDAFKNG